MHLRFPRTASLVLTGIVVFFHIYYAFHAGGLWRDESNTVALAGMPSVPDLWAHLEYDSFPVLWLLIVRFLQSFGLTADFGLRLLGCFVGLSIIATLWVNARLMKFSAPLVSLVLLGFSPTIIRWGDSMRAYGFGICLILLTFALVWKLTTSPSPTTAILTTVVAICSVHTLYYNAVLLFAIGIAGTAVAWRHRRWDRALLVMAIGGIAAVSLIPYIHAVQGAKKWNIVFSRSDFSLSLFWAKLSEALSSAGSGIRWVWVIIVTTATVVSVISQFRPTSPQEGGRRDVGLYCLVAFLVSIPAYFIFLKALGYPTQPWYYVALMSVVAIAVDGVFAAAPGLWCRGYVRMVLASAIAIWSFVPAWSAMHVRQTNIDVVAAKLGKLANTGDVIVVAPWYLGVSFARYYEGAAPWTTLPPITDHKIHRYDLLKTQMAATNPIDSVLAAMAKALRSGHQVWIVGGISFPQPGQSPPLLAPAPYDPVGWSEGAYAETWSMQAGDLLQTHALNAEIVPLPGDQPISTYENPMLIMAQGWKAP